MVPRICPKICRSGYTRKSTDEGLRDMPEHVFNQSDSQFSSLPPSFLIAQTEASDNLRAEFLGSFLDDQKNAQDLVQSRNPFVDFFDRMRDEMERRRAETGMNRPSTTRSARGELQPNGCYSSPTYESIIDNAAEKIYDPKALGDLNKLRHMYDCRISNDQDAVKYASQALKFDDDPYTSVLLDGRTFPDAAGMIGVTYKKPGPETPARRGTAPVQQWLTVESVQEGSPSARAGMLPGDQVRTVDGVSMAGKSIPEVANILRGPAATVVEVSVMRQGALKKLEMTRIAPPERTRTAADAHQAGIGAGVGLLSKDLNHLSEDNEGKISAKAGDLKPQENDLVLTAITPGSPAERAGLKRGDIVRKVDGEDIAGLSVGEAISKIRGAAGRAVELSILREGRLVEMRIVRATLRAEAVVTDRDLGEGISYIKFADFMHQDGTQQLMAAMHRHSRAKAIVLDLRDNGGGELEQAFRNISLFLWEGDAMTLDRRKESAANDPQYDVKKYSVTGTEYIMEVDDGVNRPRVQRMKREVPYMLDGRPLVILTNGNSASASELLAGALHDNGVAKLIGEKTFGKGIGQTYEEGLGYTSVTTTFRYYTPKGYWLGDAHNHRIGIKPDIAVQDSLLQGDPQLEAAKQHLRERLAPKKAS